MWKFQEHLLETFDQSRSRVSVLEWVVRNETEEIKISLKVLLLDVALESREMCSSHEFDDMAFAAK